MNTGAGSRRVRLLLNLDLPWSGNKLILAIHNVCNVRSMEDRYLPAWVYFVTYGVMRRDDEDIPTYYLPR
jgi:hypothetical protein